jgi:bla regulator protein BlaR1
VIDGREVPKDSLQSLNPGSIEAIQVLKDSIAERSYGEKGKNGVVIIHLKDSIAKPKAPVTGN